MSAKSKEYFIEMLNRCNWLDNVTLFMCWNTFKVPFDSLWWNCEIYLFHCGTLKISQSVLISFSKSFLSLFEAILGVMFALVIQPVFTLNYTKVFSWKISYILYNLYAYIEISHIDKSQTKKLKTKIYLEVPDCYLTLWDSLLILSAW